MTTTIQMISVFAAGMFARALIVIGFVALVSLPFIAFAYVARAAEGFWHRHHNSPKHAHSVA